MLGSEEQGRINSDEFSHRSTAQGLTERTMSNTQDQDNWDLEAILGTALAPEVTQENPLPTPTFPTVPDGVWRIITDRLV